MGELKKGSQIWQPEEGRQKGEPNLEPRRMETIWETNLVPRMVEITREAKYGAQRGGDKGG